MPRPLSCVQAVKLFPITSDKVTLASPRDNQAALFWTFVAESEFFEGREVGGNVCDVDCR